MNTLGKGENKKMSLLQKWSFLASNASIPWTIFIGILAVCPIYSGNELITKLKDNYKVRAEKIIQPNSNTTYQCGEGFITQYLCEDITEIVQRGREELNIDNIYKTRFIEDKIVSEIDIETIQHIKTLFETFLKNYPDNFTGELEVIGGLKKYDFKDPESISKSARELDVKAIVLAKELESHIPNLKNQIKAHSKQEYLSEEQRNIFLIDLQKLGYSGSFDIDSISQFFLFTHTKFESEENKKLYSALFWKYLGEIKLNLSGDKIVSRYTGSSLKSPLYVGILSFITLLLYTSILLPLSGAKKIKSKFLKEEYRKIQNAVNSKEELENINRYREVLGLQSYEDAVKIFHQLGSFSNGKIIRKKGINGLFFLKNNGIFQCFILNNEGKYIDYGPTITDNLILLYMLEEHGFTNENIEIIEGADLTMNFA